MRALTGLDGVGTVDVNLATKQVNVEYDASKVSVQTMQNAIMEAGFDVEA